MIRWVCLALMLTAGAGAEPGVTLLFNSRDPGQARLSAQAKQLVIRMREANGLNDVELSVSSADWADPSVAARWQREFALTGRELPALAVVRRQGNRISLDNLVRHYTAAPQAVENAFKCLALQAPNLVKQTKLRTGVALTSDPAGARVLVDGQESGTTPCDIELQPGHHSLEILQENHQAVHREVNLEMGQMLRQQVQLLAQGSYLRIESGGIPLSVSLDGAAAVPTPAMLDVKAGQHHFRATAPGHYAAEGDVTVPPERLTSVQITLVPARLRVALGNFSAEGYTGYNTRSSGSGRYYHTWEEPYQVYINANPIKDKLRGALGQYDLIDQNPDCVISLQISSNKDQIQGQATIADSQGRVRQTVQSQRDMPFLSFDEQGSAQKRAEEVADDLLSQLLPALNQFQPQAELSPPDRQAQVKVETSAP